jgi:HK97 family phage major capsid protein
MHRPKILDLHLRALDASLRQSEDVVRRAANNVCTSDFVDLLLRSMPAISDVSGFDDNAADAARAASNAIGEFHSAPPRGFYVPLIGTVGRSLSVGMFNAGGALAADVMSGELVEALRPHSVAVAGGARVISGLPAGKRLILPKLSNGSSVFWCDEGDPPPMGDPDFDQVVIVPHVLRASIVVSRMLILQNGLREALTTALEVDLLAAALAEVDRVILAGSGVDAEPLGLLNMPEVAVVSAGADGGEPTWKLLTDMEYEVGKASGAISPRWAINAATRRKLRNTQRAPGLDFILSDSPTLLGDGYGVSEALPSDLAKGAGTNLSAMVYGDFGRVIIGIWGPAALDVVLDRYSLKKDNKIRLTAFMNVGVGFRHVEAFAVCKDISTNL